jgi:hypothetical protein
MVVATNTQDALETVLGRQYVIAMVDTVAMESHANPLINASSTMVVAIWVMLRVKALGQERQLVLAILDLWAMASLALPLIYVKGSKMEIVIQMPIAIRQVQAAVSAHAMHSTKGMV